MILNTHYFITCCVHLHIDTNNISIYTQQWGSKEDKHRIHWARWEWLSHAKIKGGMGFRDFTSFNQALVSKQ